jgi:hypothetical protein
VLRLHDWTAEEACELDGNFEVDDLSCRTDRPTPRPTPSPMAAAMKSMTSPPTINRRVGETVGLAFLIGVMPNGLRCRRLAVSDGQADTETNTEPDDGTYKQDNQPPNNESTSW